MKKMMCVLIVLSFSMTIVRGQENKFDVGILGSPGITSIRYYNINILGNIHPAFGFSGGAFIQYNFPKIISIQADIAYERKGINYKYDYNVNDNGATSTMTQHTHLDYLTTSILLKASLGNKIKYFIDAGPYFGYLIKANAIYIDPLQGTTELNFTGTTNRLDAGISTGLGISIPIKDKFSLSCEVRNNLGLINLNKDTENNPSKVKTISTNLLIGFAYKLGARKM